MRIKTIALDIGNVCIRIHPGRCAAALGLPAFNTPPLEFTEKTDLMECGIISENEWLKTFSELTENKFSDEQLKKAYNSILGEEIKGIRNFLEQKIAEDYKIVFFSDTSQIHISHLYNILPFANIVNGAVFSFDVGAKKPDEKMYKAFENAYGRPDIYIDDKQENIEAGKKRFWNSFLFTDTDTLTNEINDL